MATYPELSGKIAVVSGAGGNLGMAVMHRLHAEGVKIAAIDRNADGLRKRLAEQGIPDAVFDIGAVDLTQKAAVDAFIARQAHIDILLNIAGGFAYSGPVHDMDEAGWDEMMTLNAKTAFLLSAAAARKMVAQARGGRIINVSSRSGQTGVPALSAYSASKSALIRLTESMAGELMAHHITVNAILPSVIDTPLNRQNDPQADFSKWVKPESLADVMTFLASDAARDISGASIPVYGRA